MPDSSEAGSQRKLGFAVGLVVVTLLAIETFSILVQSVLDRRLYSPARVHAMQEAVEESPELFQIPEPETIDGSLVPKDDRFVLHPYLGYVIEPSARQVDSDSMEQYGFGRSGGVLFRKNPPDVLVMAVLGGSVASGFGRRGGGQALAEALLGSSLFSGHKFDVVTMAVAGHKQPQQLMAVTYMLSRGARFDLVVNLDGLNEVAIPPYEQLPKGLNAFYPRSWLMRVGRLGPDLRASVGEFSYVRESRASFAKTMGSSPWRYSPTAQSIWRRYDGWLATRLYKLQRKIERGGSLDRSFQSLGPPHAYRNHGSLVDDLAANWERCSRLLAEVCSANGIRYYHFLQPNPYFGHKPMSSAERRAALLMTHPYRKWVRLGYPRLLKAGKRLRQDGVHFFDLTKVFDRTQEPVYVDRCCHLNRAGNVLMAKAMARAILGDVRADKEP